MQEKENKGNAVPCFLIGKNDVTLHVGDRVTSMHLQGAEAHLWYGTILSFDMSLKRKGRASPTNVMILRDATCDIVWYDSRCTALLPEPTREAEAEAHAFLQKLKLMASIHKENAAWLSRTALLAPKVSRDDYDDCCAYVR